MKKLLILVFLFFSNSVFADVYYCVEEHLIGYKTQDNNMVKLQPKRFTINLDIEKLSLNSDELLFISSTLCKKTQFDIIGCTNSTGDTFNIQLDTLNFVHTKSFAYLTNGMSETSYSVGKCELF